MTQLEAELLQILTAEAGHAPMTADSLSRVLYALGWSPLPSTTDIETTLEGLVAGGWLISAESPRLGRRYRAIEAPPGDTLPEPPPEAA
jgi:hypothetical protein